MFTQLGLKALEISLGNVTINPRGPTRLMHIPLAHVNAKIYHSITHTHMLFTYIVVNSLTCELAPSISLSRLEIEV